MESQPVSLLDSPLPSTLAVLITFPTAAIRQLTSDIREEGFILTQFERLHTDHRG